MGSKARSTPSGRVNPSAAARDLSASLQRVVKGANVKYHGRGYRRTVVLIQIIILVVFVLGHPWAGVSTQEAALRLAGFVVVVGGGGAWFALWPGLMWDEQGVTLVYALRRKRIRWEEVTQVVWRPRGSMGKALVLCTETGKSTRVPTIMRVDGTDWWARVWESNLLRSSVDPAQELDAMTALKMAWAARTGSDAN